jgi:hypothetical protein
VRVEQALAVEIDHLRDEAPESIIRIRLHLAGRVAEGLRQIVRAQRDPRDHTPASSPAAFERPEEVRVEVRVRDPYLAIRGDDLRFEQACRRGSKSLRE